MASKSVGQIVGMGIGAAVGFFNPAIGIALGASLGGVVGGLIDPPKGPTISGQRLDDLSFQTSTLGAPLGRAYGTVPVLGNVVWLEGDAYREVITSEEQGGKGGGGATYETASYYATFAVSLLRVPDANSIRALRRMWIGSNLVYDAGSDDIESILASNAESPLFTFYNGSDTQTPNTRWQADKGVNAVSGFPGRCYIVIYDLNLEPYSRSLAMAQVKVELSTYSENQTDKIVDIATYNPAAWTPIAQRFKGVVYSDIGATSCFVADNDWDGAIYGSVFGAVEFGVSQEFLAISDNAIAGGGYAHVAPGGMKLDQTDDNVIVILEDRFNSGEVLRLRVQSPGAESIGADFPANSLPSVNTGVVDRGDIYVFNEQISSKIYQINLGGIVTPSTDTFDAECLGASENYLFVTKRNVISTGVQTVYKLNRTTLALLSTYTGTATSVAVKISVESDTVFYTAAAASTSVWKWVDGVIVDSFPNVVLDEDLESFKVYSDSPVYVISTVWNHSGLPKAFYVGHVYVPTEVAKLRDIVTAECWLAGVSSGDIDLTALTNSDVRGYRIANAGSIRASLEMLQAAFPFDVAPSGYKLRFVSRGGSSLATIPEIDLGATSGGDTLPVLLPASREMDTQIPYKVSVRYLDPSREYDIGEQYASRPDTASVSERTVELSIVLTGDEAVRVADVLNQKDWIERTSFGPFSLPPTWGELEPPDVVTVEHRGQAHTIRLTRSETLPDGRIVCSGVPSSAQSYTSSATAQEALTVGQTLVPLAGSTTGYLLDIPRIRSEQDVPGMAFAMTGLASGWPGGVVLRSDDSGNSWQSIGATNSVSKVFATEDVAGAHHGYSIDHTPVLTVTSRYAAHTLSSLTEDQLYAHANLAAYGADGRWEIVAFKSVTDNTGSYTLKDFLRGLYGTEWATGLHVAGDLLVLLDTSTVGFFGLPINTLGSPRAYRFVTQGASIDSSLDFIDTYDGNNLKPLSPVDVGGDRTPTGDWNLYCVRRSRWPVELLSGVEVPLGETSEAYICRVYSVDWSQMIREFSGLSSPAVFYSAAQETTDFGTLQTNLNVKWYQVSSVVGMGHSNPISIVRPGYVIFNYVTSLLHFNSAAGSSAFVDETDNIVTVTGSVISSSAQGKFSGVSGYFPGGTAKIELTPTSKFFYGTGDFTVEGWFYVSAQTDNYYTISNVAHSGGNMLVRFGNAGYGYKLQFSMTDASASVVYSTPYTQASMAGAWHYFKLFRESGVVKFVVDNAQASFGSGVNPGSYPMTSISDTTSINATSVTVGLGFYGWLDEMRSTKGLARTGTTAPTTEFPNSDDL